MLQFCIEAEAGVVAAHSEARRLPVSDVAVVGSGARRRGGMSGGGAACIVGIAGRDSGGLSRRAARGSGVRRRSLHGTTICDGSSDSRDSGRAVGD